jgi:hypothetical protein
MSDIWGYIYSAADDQPIEGVTIWQYNTVNKTATAKFTLEDNSYHVWNEFDTTNIVVYFEKPGYEKRGIPFDTLYQNSEVLLEKGIPVAMYAAALAIIAFMLATHKKQGKKLSGFNTADIMPFLYIGGGLIAFSLVKKVLEKLGLWDSKDTKDLDNAANDPNSFWNPNYWITIKPPNQNYSYAINESTAKNWCKEIYDAFGPFDDCEECAISVFKRCRTKANASFLVWVFQREYSMDLLGFLRGGLWPKDRLSDADVNVINQFINGLPNY